MPTATDRFSNLTICYEGIQRIDRNAVVSYVRRRLTGSKESQPTDAVSTCFTEEEWNRVKANAAESRALGVVESQIADSFDLLSVNHFFNVFDRYYLMFFGNGTEEANVAFDRSFPKSVCAIERRCG